MKQIRQVMKEIRHWGLNMNFIKSIKLKSSLIIIMSISFTTFIIYGLLNTIYFSSHERHMKNYISNLLIEIEKDYDRIEDVKQWTEGNLNLNIYSLDSVEALLVEIPSSIDKNKVLSTSDIEMLNSGKTVINKIKTPDQSLNLLVFIHPIIKNNQLENLLFVHVPFDNLEGEEIVFSRLTILLSILSVGITIITFWKIFGKSFRQLKDIKLAAVEVSKGNFDTKIFENSKDEVGEITEAFNVMSTKLKNEHNRAKEFMEDFSHEIKAPLALAKNYNQALMDKMIQDPEEQQKCYHLIDREMNRMQKLIQNFLDFTKLEAQSVELVKHPIVFAQTVEDIMSKYELVFKENNIKLDMKLDYDVIISADEDRLEQIIQNIVHNAIKYSKEEPSIRIIMERNETSCILVISDNGVGISEEHLAIITNRFVRVNKVHSRKDVGTGLGLSIVEKLMELHKGKMIIESQLGVGTTVKLEFPILID
mgnify:FL=1